MLRQKNCFIFKQISTWIDRFIPPIIMNDDIKKYDEELRNEALSYHIDPEPGKLSVISSKPLHTQKHLSLAYSPGVAYPCLEISKDPKTSYQYTSRGNLVGVISNGTAVLGLGNIGAAASKPVMEGKALLFKKFANIDSFDIEVEETNIEKFVQIVKGIAITFGGINLEDIKAPECFEIERRLIEELDIPVMHDDQHGTAIITSAALINSCRLLKKNISSLKIVVVGAGAAAIPCARMYKTIGVKNIYMIDSRGLITDDRQNLTSYKKEFACPSTETKESVFQNADVILGLSFPGTFTIDDIKKMNKECIIFALANPTPELYPNEIKEVRPEAIVATGRSDFDNQVNNAIAFPYIFRGALDCRAKHINMEMKVAAAEAIAELAREEVPAMIRQIFGKKISFSKDYIIPKPFDKRLLTKVSIAVAKTALSTKVAPSDFDLDEYQTKLEKMEETS
ncbi:hypothetical protein SNEBB_009617 [Seison nebaliae]|nr:hypothetical protein SNEBB_009617 [Seison nebaliae]